MAERLHIAVVGAGIGGLSAAIALGRSHDVTMFERTPSFQAVGAGLAVAANAVAGLRTLGVDPADFGRKAEIADIRLGTGKVLREIVLDEARNRFGTTFVVSRPDLHRALSDALPTSVETVFQAAIEHIDPSTGTVHRAGCAPQSFDLVVAADGIHSAARGSIAPTPALRYSGMTCWRGLVDDWGLRGGIEYWGDRARIGLAPLPGSIYYFLVASAPAGQAGPADLAALRQQFLGFDESAMRVFDVLDGLPPYHHDLWELDEPVWGSGRLALLGDAAHAMTPNLGQGAAMAIEDALALAVSLDRGLDGIVDRYRALRHRRVRRVQLDSRRVGRLAHLHRPAARRIRNWTMRAMPARVAIRQQQGLVRPGIDLARTYAE